MTSNHLILVAAGSGSRMNNELPKQFLKLNGKEVLLKCVERFRTFDPNIHIVVAINRQYRSLVEGIIQDHHLRNIELCEGGETRFHSVRNALQCISDPDSIIAVHDAARPFVSFKTINNCFDTANKKGNAIPVVHVSETLRHLDKNESHTVPRSEFRLVQTPQCFRSHDIKKAYEQEYSERFTDDASVAESIGIKIHLVEGNPENIKITFPVDLILAKALADAEQ